MDARRSHMVVLRGVGVLLVLLLGSVLALVQPASAAPALIATESPRPPDNVQADHTGMIDDDPHPPDSTPSAISDDDATTRPTSSQNQDPAPAHSDSEAASQPSAPGAPGGQCHCGGHPAPAQAPTRRRGGLPHAHDVPRSRTGADRRGQSHLPDSGPAPRVRRLMAASPRAHLSVDT